MAATTQERMTPRRSMEEPLYDNYPVRAGAKCLLGTMAEVKDGLAAPAGTSAAPDFFVFVLHGADNTGGADGDVVLERAEFRSSWLFNVSTAIARTNLGDPVYALDNQTVAFADQNKGFVGRLMFFDDDGAAGHHSGNGTQEAYIQIDGPLKRQTP